MTTNSGTTTGRPAKTASQLVTEAKARITNLTVEQAEAEVKAGAMVVDIREAEELAREGIIPGAVHAPRGMLEFYADPSSPYHRPPFAPGRRVVLYCASGGRSALAAVALQGLGYADVAHLDGGIRAWKDSGRQVEPGPASR